MTYLDVDQFGLISTEALKKAITSDTKLISIMYANNETGIIQPIDEIADIAHHHNIPFHCDAVQSIGKSPLSLLHKPDFITLSGHKLGAPKGVGAIISKHPLQLIPLIHGGSQEFELRAGTENLLGIAGFSKAIECSVFDNNYFTAYKNLTSWFEGELIANINDIHLNHNLAYGLPGTLNIAFFNISSESLVMTLDFEGVSVSTGAACSSGTTKPSHVISAMTTDSTIINSSIRISFSASQESDLKNALPIFKTTISRLRS